MSTTATVISSVLLTFRAKRSIIMSTRKAEAFYVCGIINAPVVTEVVDGYAISTNRGVDVLKYIAIPKYDATNEKHNDIAKISMAIHEKAREGKDYSGLEKQLSNAVYSLFSEEG